jgi:hypothetical protein
MPANNPPPPEYPHTTELQLDLPTPLTHNNTQQHYTTALGNIKLPMYQLFLWRLYLMVLRGATSLLVALEGVGPENLDFFGPIKTKGTLKVITDSEHCFAAQRILSLKHSRKSLSFFTSTTSVEGVLNEPFSAKPAQLSSHTGPPGYIKWIYVDWRACTATPLSGFSWLLGSSKTPATEEERSLTLLSEPGEELPPWGQLHAQEDLLLHLDHLVQPANTKPVYSQTVQKVYIGLFCQANDQE